MKMDIYHTYGEFRCTDNEGDEGYVQGMSDLCAPIYVVMSGDEEMTFWCFVEVMNRMVCLTIFCWIGPVQFLDRNRISIEIRAE